MILRLNEKGEVVTEGAQILIGGNNVYISTCRKHFKLKEFDLKKYAKKLKK